MAKFNSIRKWHLAPINNEERTLCGQRNFKGKKYGMPMIVVSVEKFINAGEILQCAKCKKMHDLQ